MFAGHSRFAASFFALAALFAAPYFGSPAGAAEVESDVRYGRADGEELLLDVYLPVNNSASQKRPAVLLVHGGGWRSGSRKAESMVAMGHALADAGYVAFSIEYRLLEQDGDAWRNQYPAAIDDCRQAVRWVRQHADEYRIDAAKLGAFGTSAGGHLAALLGTSDAPANGNGDQPEQPSCRVQAVVDVFGPTDLTGDFSHLKVGDRNVQQLVDAFLRSPEHKREASPLHHIDDQSAAFLILHGDKDPIVPVQQSRSLHAALQKAGRKSEYVEIAGAGHGFAGEDAKTLRSKAIAFFDRELKDNKGEEGKKSAAKPKDGEAPAPDLSAMFKMHYANRVRAFKEQNQQLQHVVLLGDSITEGFDVAKFFPGRRVLNRGIGADVIGNALPKDDPRGVLRRLDESVFHCAATDVFLLIGVNDLGSGRTPDAMEPGYREILQRIKTDAPRVRVHVQSVLPTRGRFAKHNAPVLDFNARIKKLAEEFEYDYIDLHSLMADEQGELKAEFTGDGLHLNAEAYAIWQKEIERAMGW